MSSLQNQDSPRISRGRNKFKFHEDYKFIRNRVYLLSAFIGDKQKPFNTYKGFYGLILWTCNLVVHFSLDFYESVHHFHISWSSAIGIYLIGFIIWTIFTIKHTIPWFLKLVQRLTGYKYHKRTINKLVIVFKYAPVVMVIVSISGAAAQFGCYFADGALQLKLMTNSTTLPIQVEQFINVLRMTSLIHILYAFWFFLLFNLVSLYTLMSSMREFNDHMKDLLKSEYPPVTFMQAVNLITERTKWLRTASAESSIVLSTILLATSLSFVVNAYNFLFVKQFAIYIWFAIAPLIWMVSPLIFGAWVTATYRQYKNIIIEAWVQVPENDEVELKVKRILDPNVGENGIHYSLGTETESKFKSSLAVESEQDNFVNLENNDYSSICSTVDNDLPTDITVASEESVMTEVIAICNDRNRVTERQRKMHKCAAKSTTDSENEPSCCLGSADLHASEIYLNNPSTSWKPTKQIIPRKTRIPPLDDIDLQSDGHLNDTHRGSNDTEKDLPDIMLMNTMGTGRKFNYEKYIKYIEITSGTIGFSIAGVVITLDRVSFFCGMLLTFVGVFAQTAILKAGRTNVQRVN